MAGLVLEAEGLAKRFCRRADLAARYAFQDILRDLSGTRGSEDRLRPGEFWALRDAALQVEEGEVVGVIGHNGAGKSTLMSLAAGLIRPTLGSIRLRGQAVAIEAHAGLNPVQSGAENLANKLVQYGFSSDRLTAAVAAAADFAELDEVLEAPVGSYSTGMRLRLTFAIYSQIRPSLYLIDEAIGGGDLRFQNKFRRYLVDYTAGGGAILLASHDLFAIQGLCRRCVLLHEGRVRSVGTPDEMIAEYHALMLPPTTSVAVGGAPEPPAIGVAAAGLCRIVELDVSAGDGGMPRTLEPLSIRLVCDAEEAFPRILLVVELGSAGRMGIVTMLAGHGDPPLRLAPGRNEFRMNVDRLPLMPGTYELRVGLCTREGSIILGMAGFEGKKILLQVKSSVGPAVSVALLRESLLILPLECERLEDAAEAPTTGAVAL